MLKLKITFSNLKRGLLLSSLIVGASSCLSQGAYNNDVQLEIVQAEIDDMRYELHNVSSDLQLAGERLANQDVAQEQLQEKVIQASQVDHLRMESHLSELEKRYHQLEAAYGKQGKEMQRIQSYSKEVTTSLEQYKNRIVELELAIGKQQKSFENRLNNLSVAVSGTLEAMQKGSGFLKDINSYVVEKGDSLGEIAKRYNTSVTVIKELNDLDSDMIYIGQNLKLPIKKEIR
jgi:LysM repeat protein